ncbi:MAG: Fe-S cluster assembly protein SufD [Anaerolineales bacterium]|nr:Fe-S cluster assembly protein SufD [Anaerolineales bacterium]
MSTRTVVRREPDSRRTGAAEFRLTEADIRRRAAASGEPGWVLEARLRAWQRYLSLPMPEPRDEAWRRTDLSGLPADHVQWLPVDDLPVDPALLLPITDESQAGLMILRPGLPTLANVDPGLGGRGVVFTDWSTAVRDHSRLLQQNLGRLVDPASAKFAALAAAVADTGVILYVPPGVVLEQPLHSVIWAPGAGRAFATRVLVVLGKGAAATFIHEFASPTEPENAAFHAGTLEVIVEDEAQLTLVELQTWGEHVWTISHEKAQVGAGGRVDWIFGAVGSHLTKNFSELSLVGEGAEGRMSGFYFTDGMQHLDHDTQQNHLAPHTTSDLLFKGALIGKSRSVWQGMIYVAPGAQKSDGYQANRNLLLSRGARADSIPGLEILADDVRCTHGATVGRLEEEPLYYLMTRGIPRADAERLVVHGFFAPIMSRIPFEGVRERFQRMIDEKMRQSIR